MVLTIATDELIVCDLFCGAGGFTDGFKKSGAKVVIGVDDDWVGVKSYEINNFSSVVMRENLTSRSVIDDVTSSCHNLNVNVIIGGVPCQSFSSMGKRKVDDDRDDLWKSFYKIVRKVKPQFFVIENVQGIMTKKKSDGTLIIDEIQKYFRKIGYQVSFKILDASRFGVPQRRKRVFIVGRFPPYDYEFPTGNDDVVSVRDAISDLADAEENLRTSHVYVRHSSWFVQRISKIKKGKNLYGNGRPYYERLDADKPSKCVMHNNGCTHVHPWKNRVITPREVARLQSFTDDYLFVGNKKQVLTQICNAVPPLLAKSIADSIKRSFQKYHGK